MALRPDVSIDDRPESTEGDGATRRRVSATEFDAPRDRGPGPLRSGSDASPTHHEIGARGTSPHRRAQIGRLARYGATSVIAFGMSEATLLALYGNGIANATVAALIANLVGTVPTYFMSRYWIWKDAARTRVGRQVVLYWTTSLVCLALTSVAAGVIAASTPAGYRFHLVVVAFGFFAVTLVLWLAKFAVYQRAVFPAASQPTRLSSDPLAGGIGVADS
jgi:putative flippase GtrA